MDIAQVKRRQKERLRLMSTRPTSMIQFVEDDGGRKAAGYKGTTGDCVVRAIAVATGKSYEQVYDGLWHAQFRYSQDRNDRVAKQLLKQGVSPRKGVYRKVCDKYLASMGWEFHPTMSIGSGCKVHLRADELPKGRIIVRASKHMAAVVDGVLHDTRDCSREGMRCVYGYYQRR